MLRQEFLDPQREVNSVFRLDPAMALFGVDDPLRRVACCAQGIAHARAMRKWHAHVGTTVSQSHRCFDTVCMFDRRGRCKRFGVFDRVAQANGQGVLNRVGIDVTDPKQFEQ